MMLSVPFTWFPFVLAIASAPPTANAYVPRIPHQRALPHLQSVATANKRVLVRKHVSTERSIEASPTVSGTPPRSCDGDSYASHVVYIRSCNLAGTTTDGGESDITISLGDGPNLVAVTGETGSGKSLLVAKAADLVTGGKATSSSVPTGMHQSAVEDNRRTFVEMVLRLNEPHLAMVQRSLELVGLDPAALFKQPSSTSVCDSSSMVTLTLRRELVMEGDRLRSICFMNQQAVSLDALRTVSSPLLAIVDASAAAAALAKQTTRMSILDTGVPDPVLSYARITRAEYRKCRGYRRRLQKELSNRILPVSMSDTEHYDSNDIELLQHWIDELDAFEQRMSRFCDAVDGEAIPASNLAMAIEALSSASWFDDLSTDDSSGQGTFSSALYASVVNFREALNNLERQLEAGRHARDALSSLSSPESAITALERSRKHLIDATGKEDATSPLSSAAEKSHDLLNKVEQAIRACTHSLDDDDNAGVLSMLETARRSINLSTEDLDIIIGDWNTLARKHGIPPFSLPACHRALRLELDGNVEARQLLPEATKRESEALDRFETACSMLTNARQKVAKQLSRSVSRRLPSLGMTGSTFFACVREDVMNCTDASAYASTSQLGLDCIDFLLFHGTGAQEQSESPSTTTSTNSKGGKVDIVASSGEKARILLAIECELPGSIGAASRAFSWNDGVRSASTHEQSYCREDAHVPPVAVIYDEIDAHVGGRAAVAMADMLADQSRKGKVSSTRGQVVSITHSPSVAAVADMHVLVQTQAAGDKNRGRASVKATVVGGVERRKELARMAAGDLAQDEAETFADALLRDGGRRRSNETFVCNR